MDKSKKWDKRFMQMTELVATWSSCIRPNRQVGAVIVRDKRILATGYNGAPSGVKSCVERGECLREKLGIESGTRQEMCYAVHAEQNAIAQAAKMGHRLEGTTIYITHSPCSICARLIINSGIKRIVFRDNYPDEFSLQLLEEAGIVIEKFEGEKTDSPKNKEGKCACSCCECGE